MLFFILFLYSFVFILLLFFMMLLHGIIGYIAIDDDGDGLSTDTTQFGIVSHEHYAASKMSRLNSNPQFMTSEQTFELTSKSHLGHKLGCSMWA